MIDNKQTKLRGDWSPAPDAKQERKHNSKLDQGKDTRNAMPMTKRRRTTLVEGVPAQHKPRGAHQNRLNRDDPEDRMPEVMASCLMQASIRHTGHK